MSNQEEDALKEIFVRVRGSDGDKSFDIPTAIINHYSIVAGDGIICMLKEKMDENMKNAETVEKEILIDSGSNSYGRPFGWIPEATCNLYDINNQDYVCLLIRKVIHKG
jgi:hypothetical protein